MKLFSKIAVCAAFLLMSIPCWGRDHKSFHSQARLSDTDKVALLTQHLEQAIQHRNIDKIIRCLSAQLNHDKKIVDSVTARFSSIFNRLNHFTESAQKRSAFFKPSTYPPTLRITRAQPISIMRNGAVAKHDIYIGECPGHYNSRTEIRFKSWRGIYGVTNIFELADKLDSLIDGVEGNPQFLTSPETGKQRAKAGESGAAIQNLLKHKVFYPAENIDVFDKPAARSNFKSKELYSRPYDIIEVIIYDNDLGDLWGQMVTDGNWDRLIYFVDKDFSGNPGVFGRDYHRGRWPSTENMPFRFSAGVSLLTDQDLYVCDVYNNQVAQYRITVGIDSSAMDDISCIDLHLSLDSLCHPIDIDAGHIPVYLPINYGCHFDNWLAICDQGNNRIVITHRYGAKRNEIGRDPNLHQLNYPTSVAFARDWQTGWQRHDIYVADADNKRVVKYYKAPWSDIGSYDRSIASHDLVFEESAYLSSIEVDAFGQVYVLDAYNGVIHKFDEDLNYMGKWGGIGTGVDSLYWPVRMSVTRGWENKYDSSCGGIILVPVRMGDVLITEQYTETTGIKRFEFGNDLTDFSTSYFERDCNVDTLVGDKIDASWYQHDYGMVRLVFGIADYGTVEEYNNLFIPGEGGKSFNMPSDAPTVGTYTVDIYLYSIYNGSLLQYLSDTGPYDRDTCNYPPQIDSMPYITGNDSCFMYNAWPSYECAVDAFDQNDPPESLKYTWVTEWCDEVNRVGLFIHPDSAHLPADEPPYHWYRDSITTYHNRILLRPDKGSLPAPPSCPDPPPSPKIKAPVNVIFTVRIEDPHGGWIKRHFSIPFGKGDSTCAPDPDPPPDDGCPILYWDDNGKWKMINNILAESGIENRESEYVSEIYPVFDVTTNEDGELRLRITEETNEVTSLQSIRASIISYPDSVRLIYTDKNRPFALSLSRLNPEVAYTARGYTVTKLIDHVDYNYFKDSGPGYLVVEYVFDSLVWGFPKPLTDNPGGGGFPPPDKNIEKKRCVEDDPRWTGFYECWVLDKNGSWVSVAKAYPRMVRHKQYVELSDYIFDNRLTMKIEYGDRICLDELPFYFFKPVDVAIHPLKLVSAIHSKKGDAISSITSDQSSDLIIRKGEYTDLVFQGPGPKPGYKQLLLLASKGKYESAESHTPSGSEIVFEQNYPNPFNANTTFRFYLPEAGHVKLEIFNVLGQTVRVLVNDMMPSGRHAITWDGRNLGGDLVASGVYFARFTTGDYTATKKLEVLK